MVTWKLFLKVLYSRNPWPYPIGILIFLEFLEFWTELFITSVSLLVAESERKDCYRRIKYVHNTCCSCTSTCYLLSEWSILTCIMLAWGNMNLWNKYLQHFYLLSGVHIVAYLTHENHQNSWNTFCYSYQTLLFVVSVSEPTS